MKNTIVHHEGAASLEAAVGVIEVQAGDGSQFGVEGLRESVRSNLDQPTESLLDAIVSDVYKFGDSTVLTDDACLVAAELSAN
jgi:serine phosphatase RsbU (regulator of sigma subunit)